MFTKAKCSSGCSLYLNRKQNPVYCRATRVRKRALLTRAQAEESAHPDGQKVRRLRGESGLPRVPLRSPPYPVPPPGTSLSASFLMCIPRQEPQLQKLDGVKRRQSCANVSKLRTRGQHVTKINFAQDREWGEVIRGQKGRGWSPTGRPDPERKQTLVRGWEGAGREAEAAASEPRVTISHAAGGHEGGLLGRRAPSP